MLLTYTSLNSSLYPRYKHIDVIVTMLACRYHNLESFNAMLESYLKRVPLWDDLPETSTILPYGDPYDVSLCDTNL